MRILIVGAGATGGYYGARLLAAGRDVTFLVRPARAAQLASEGLHLESHGGNVAIPRPPTVLANALTAPFDLILLSCKAHDLAGAIDSFAPAVGPQSAILPLLNGMAHMAALDARFGPAHVLGGATNVSAARTPGGRIQHFAGPDRLYFGDRTDPAGPRMQRIAATLADAGFESHLRPHILQDMWDKWAAIATGASLTCLMRGSIGEIEAAGGAPLIRRLLAENAAIAAAAGFPPSQTFLDGVAAFLTTPGSDFKSSMLRDLESGAPIEARQIVGDLLDHARQHAVHAPTLEIVDIHLRTYIHRRTHSSPPGEHPR